jgi:hypothetical protein
MKKWLVVIIALAVIISSVALATARNEKTFSLPSHAREVAPGLFDLGTAEVDGVELQGYAFVDYRKGFSHKPQHPANGGTGSCFAFLARGAKWKTVEEWIVNPANNEGLSNSFVFNNLAADLQKWEDAAVADIFGSGTTTTDTLVADTSSPDDKNEVYFADVDSPGAIAVTIVWGIFAGPPSGRELVEWDQIYDDVDFTWSASGEAGKMDFENIATHEVGHSGGMGHPSDSCTEETMFRFASLGETKKRTLNTGDTTGVKQLYG